VRWSDRDDQHEQPGQGDGDEGRGKDEQPFTGHLVGFEGDATPTVPDESAGGEGEQRQEEDRSDARVEVWTQEPGQRGQESRREDAPEGQSKSIDAQEAGQAKLRRAPGQVRRAEEDEGGGRDQHEGADVLLEGERYGGGGAG
jgi:hypothetical protein